MCRTFTGLRASWSVGRSSRSQLTFDPVPRPATILSCPMEAIQNQVRRLCPNTRASRARFFLLTRGRSARVASFWPALAASRDMFMLGSTRKDFAEAFFTPDAEEWRAAVLATDGAVAAAEPSVPLAAAGPLLVDVVLPFGEAAVEVACEACAAATERWLSWMGAAEKLDQRRIMMVFAHDAKVRAMCYAATLRALEVRLGASPGGTLASADAGPLDIADRGAGLNAAATTNFDDEEKDQSVVDMLKIGESNMPYSGQSQ